MKTYCIYNFRKTYIPKSQYESKSERIPYLPKATFVVRIRTTPDVSKLSQDLQTCRQDPQLTTCLWSSIARVSQGQTEVARLVPGPVLKA